MGYRIDPRAAFAEEIRRIFAQELGEALERLTTASSDADKAVHECRQRLKRLRALIALIRTGDKEFARAENARYRDAARELAGSREAGAMIETVDRLAEEFPKKAAFLGAAREALLADRDRVLSVRLDRAMADAAGACRLGMDRLDALSLPGEPGPAADILAGGAARTLRLARRALRDAETNGLQESFHDLRKAVKSHGSHLSLLRDFWPSGARKRRKAVRKLGDALGDLQDISVLRRRLREGDPPFVQQSAEELDRLCERSEKRLRKACLRQASRLFEDRPGQVAGKIAGEARRRFGAT